jgi:hypothetical protein
MHQQKLSEMPWRFCREGKADERERKPSTEEPTKTGRTAEDGGKPGKPLVRVK